MCAVQSRPSSCCLLLTRAPGRPVRPRCSFRAHPPQSYPAGAPSCSTHSPSPACIPNYTLRRRLRQQRQRPARVRMRVRAGGAPSRGCPLGCSHGAAARRPSSAPAARWGCGRGRTPHTAYRMPGGHSHEAVGHAVLLAGHGLPSWHDSVAQVPKPNLLYSAIAYACSRMPQYGCVRRHGPHLPCRCTAGHMAAGVVGSAA